MMMDVVTRDESVARERFPNIWHAWEKVRPEGSPYKLVILAPTPNMAGIDHHEQVMGVTVLMEKFPEDEIAAILSHEMGHAYAPGGTSGVPIQFAQMGLISRSDWMQDYYAVEMIADRWGIDRMIEIGYDPWAVVRAMERTFDPRDHRSRNIRIPAATAYIEKVVDKSEPALAGATPSVYCTVQTEEGPVFNKRHYEAIARVFNAVPVQEEARRALIVRMADMLQADSLSFDRARFLKAAGYPLPRDWAGDQAL